MEFLGIGPLELMFILIIVLLVLGPKDIEKTARNLGRLLNRVYRSPNYSAIRHASQELRNLPQRLAREAQLDELRELEALKQVEKDLKQTASTINAAQKPFQAWVEDLKASPPKPSEPQAPAALPAANPPGAETPTPPAEAAVEPPAHEQATTPKP